MDITFGEFDVAMNNPDKKDKFISELMSKVEIIEDENGERIEIIRLKDIVLNPTFLKGTSQSPLSPILQNSITAMASKISADITQTALPEAFEMRYKNSSNMEMRDDDVVVISFPKTGSHWICNLVHFMLKTGPLENEVSIEPPAIHLFPWILIDGTPSPRVLITHMKPEYAPKDIFKKRGKAILLFRNPKDTAVSFFHYMRDVSVFHKMGLSWNYFLEHSMKGLIPPMDFFDFYNAWEKAISENQDTGILVLHFEKMKKDPINELKKINAFLGLSNDETRLQQVLAKCSVEQLRNDINSGKVPSPLVKKDGKSALYRKGVIGDWKNYFTVAQNEAMDELIKKKFKDSMFEVIC